MALSAGDKLGPYEIIAPIGSGGMGEVFRARDSRLDRVVAIKRLTGAHSARFEQEARAIAALNHPHICQIYDIGPDYLVMEYVEGKPLAGPAPVPVGVKLAIQITGALEEAHSRGILHRDLKPDNILVTTRGAAKLIDFGLARLMTESVDVTRTIEGTVMGTAAYMAPEQAEGKPLDERSDIFSLGAVLYELFSGSRAFPGTTMTQVLLAVMRDQPPPLSVPAELDAILRKCLAKAPAERFAGVGEIREALENLGLSASQTIVSSRVIAPLVPVADLNAESHAESHAASIAVLPFANLSADKDSEYFSDGLAEEILNALGQVEGLNVAARTSSFSFKGTGASLSEIASKLKVANILEGSVRRAGNRVRVTVQLVDADKGFHLWSERYDRQMEDIFDVQDEIARAVTERFKITLSGGVRRATTNIDAYELYLKGRHHWHQRSPATLRVAIQCFEQTIALDPQFALAYAGLADCYGILRVYGWIPAEEGQSPAHAAMTQAMKLAPALWETNFSQGMYSFFFERDWHGAGPYFRKAVEIHPRSSLAQVYYSLFLATEGRPEEAAAHAALALEYDPLSSFIHGIAGGALYAVEQFGAAVREADQSLELQPDYLFGLWVRGLALCGMGRTEDAIVPLERAVTLLRAPLFVSNLGLAYARAGRLDDASQSLRELEERGSRGEYIPAFTALAIHVGLGDLPGMRAMLAKSLRESTPPLSFRMTCGHFLEAFRGDAEIDRMLFELYGR